MRETRRVRVEEPTQAGEARRTAIGLCQDLGFSELDIARVSLLVTEAATNLAKHARGGEILLRPLERGGGTGIEVLAVDRGPGMSNPSRSFRDGFSTTGSPGTGLGALQRSSSAFDLYSQPGKGTVVMCRAWASRPIDIPPGRLETGGVSITMTDGEPCGDTWAAVQAGSRARLLVCDGLGHGMLAAEASREAGRLFLENQGSGLTGIVDALHRGLRSTRGAALAVLEADDTGGVVRYCGIGNIGARIAAGDTEKHLVSLNGIAGGKAPRVQEFSHPWPDGALLVVHSDGLGTHWHLSEYPGLGGHHPSVVAAVLYRDCSRGRDDTTVVVARRRPADAGAATPRKEEP